MEEGADFLSRGRGHFSAPTCRNPPAPLLLLNNHTLLYVSPPGMPKYVSIAPWEYTFISGPPD